MRKTNYTIEHGKSQCSFFCNLSSDSNKKITIRCRSHFLQFCHNKYSTVHKRTRFHDVVRAIQSQESLDRNRRVWSPNRCTLDNGDDSDTETKYGAASTSSSLFMPWPDSERSMESRTSHKECFDSFHSS